MSLTKKESERIRKALYGGEPLTSREFYHYENQIENDEDRKFIHNLGYGLSSTGPLKLEEVLERNTNEKRHSVKCPEGMFYVHGYKRKDGTYVRGFCKKL